MKTERTRQIMRSTKILTDVLTRIKLKKVAIFSLQMWKMHRKILLHLNIYEIFGKDKNNFYCDEAEFKYNL